MEKLQDIVLEHFNKYIEQGMSGMLLIIFIALTEGILMRTYNIGFYEEISKIIP